MNLCVWVKSVVFLEMECWIVICLWEWTWKKSVWMVRWKWVSGVGVDTSCPDCVTCNVCRWRVPLKTLPLGWKKAFLLWGRDSATGPSRHSATWHCLSLSTPSPVVSPTSFYSTSAKETFTPTRLSSWDNTLLLGSALTNPPTTIALRLYRNTTSYTATLFRPSFRRNNTKHYSSNRNNRNRNYSFNSNRTKLYSRRSKKKTKKKKKLPIIDSKGKGNTHDN